MKDQKIITDVDTIKSDIDFQKSLSHIKRVQKVIEGLDIQTRDDQARGGEIRVQLKTIYKAIETKRKSFVNPLQDVVKKLNGEFKPKLTEITNIVGILDLKLLSYQDNLDEIARKEREKVEAQNQKKMEKFEKKVADGKVTAPPILNETKVENKSSFQTKNGKSVYTRPLVDFEIENLELVPREYFNLDEQRVRKVIQAGGIIPGIKKVEKRVIGSRV